MRGHLNAHIEAMCCSRVRVGCVHEGDKMAGDTHIVLHRWLIIAPTMDGQSSKTMCHEARASTHKRLSEAGIAI